jgi:hypothetical protein
MGPWGALIMGFFGGVFFAAAGITGGLSLGPWLLLPVFVLAVIGGVAWRMIKTAPPGHYEPPARVARVITRATIFEGAGIPLVCAGLGLSGHPGRALAGIALVVGVHFLMMGRGIPFRPFWVIGLALLAASAAGFLLAPPAGAAVAGLASAMALWTAAGLALGRPLYDRGAGIN